MNIINSKLNSLLSLLAGIFVVLIVFCSFQLGFTAGLRAAAGLFALLLLPGLALSFALWDISHFNLLERLIVALTLSIATIPMITYILSKYGVPITGATTGIVIGAIIFLSVSGILLRLFFAKSHSTTSSE